MYIDENNEYWSDEDQDYLIEEDPEILADMLYEKNIQIISFYKEQLMKEPEFIGIKNMCSGKILDIIQNTKSPIKFNKTTLTNDQVRIFNNMYADLELNLDYYIYTAVKKKIFDIIYV
jgi:hypothetical protein